MDPNSHEQAFLLMGTIQITINSLLVAYSTWKLVRLLNKPSSKKSNLISSPDSISRHVKVPLFSLIVIVTLPRLICDIVLLIRSAIGDYDDDTSNAMVTFFDKLPLFCLISVASYITSSWYEIYSSFNGERGLQIRFTRTKYEIFLIIFNILIYVSFIILFTLSLTDSDPNIPIAITTLIFTGLVTVTGLLIGVGREFLRRILTRTDYKGQAMKPSVSFKIIFVSLVFCCVIRSLEQLTHFQSDRRLPVVSIMQLFSMDPSHYDIVYILSSILFYVIGESGTAACLILIINVNAVDSSSKIMQRRSSVMEISSRVGVESDSDVTLNQM